MHIRYACKARYVQASRIHTRHTHAHMPCALTRMYTRTHARNSPHKQTNKQTTGEWKLERNRNHRVFKRVVMMLDGDIKPQTITMSCTPSDPRACHNALAELHRSLGTVACWTSWIPSTSGGIKFKCTVYQWRYKKATTELFALEAETKEHRGPDATLRCKKSEVDGLLQMWVLQQSVVEC